MGINDRDYMKNLSENKDIKERVNTLKGTINKIKFLIWRLINNK